MSDMRAPFIKIWIGCTPTCTADEVTFRATSDVPGSWRGAPGVFGGGISGEDPAFVDGRGKTPTMAIEQLERNVGRAYLYVIARDDA